MPSTCHFLGLRVESSPLGPLLSSRPRLSQSVDRRRAGPAATPPRLNYLSITALCAAISPASPANHGHRQEGQEERQRWRRRNRCGGDKADCWQVLVSCSRHLAPPPRDSSPVAMLCPTDQSLGSLVGTTAPPASTTRVATPLMLLRRLFTLQNSNLPCHLIMLTTKCPRCLPRSPFLRPR